MWAGWARRWTTDDGFINFRIVHMLVEGHGPVFNVGERVETYTSPLWLGTLALGDLLLPLRLEYVSLALSIPLAGLGIVAMGSGARRLWQGPTDRWWLPCGTIVVLAIAADVGLHDLGPRVRRDPGLARGPHVGARPLGHRGPAADGR